MSRERATFAYLVPVVCGAELLTMIGVFAFPALLPQFIAEWGLTNTEAGWIAGIRFAGYAAGVPILVTITDHMDARRVYIGGAALAATGLAGFALFAEGFLTALLFEFLAGAGLAATYMPGLRVLVDRYKGARQTRAVAFYTASFSLGTALSFLIAGELAPVVGWQTLFGVTAAAAALAGLVMFAALWPVMPEAPQEKTSFLDVRPVLRNRRAMGYILGYFAHNWELFAFRGWLVAFLTFSLTLTPGTEPLIAPTTAAMFTGLAAMVASIGGAEIAEKLGRRATVTFYGALSGVAALGIGFLAGLPYVALVAVMIIYAMFIQLDSAALTVGTVSAAAPGRRGLTLGVHSLIGFAGAAIGPLAFGFTLDLTGAGSGIGSWGWAFLSIGAVTLMGPVALRLLRPRRT